MSSHADTIRRSLPDCSCEHHKAVSSALDALLAENQRLREAWRLVERYGNNHEGWRLVFRRGDIAIEFEVNEDQWRAFDAREALAGAAE